MSHINSNRRDLVARVRRIGGQLAAVERALAADAGCAEILQQVAAARGAIGGLMDEIIEDHLREHVARADLDAAARQAGADELIAVIRRYAK